MSFLFCRQRSNDGVGLLNDAVEAGRAALQIYTSASWRK